MTRMLKKAAIAACALLLLAPAPGSAQQDGAPFSDSLMFTPADIAMIQRIMAGKPDAAGALPVPDATGRAIPMKRTIAVAGIIYRSNSDWIVWMNGRKVTPHELLPEIIDIQVQEDRVHLKWFDIGINGVISISLRPQQTYDIVTGVLLPG